MSYSRTPRLRRTPAASPPTDPYGHRSGLPVSGHALHAPMNPSPQGEVGVVTGEATSSTNPGAGPGTCIGANYRDDASQPKPTKAPLAQPMPFELKR